MWPRNGTAYFLSTDMTKLSQTPFQRRHRARAPDPKIGEIAIESLRQKPGWGIKLLVQSLLFPVPKPREINPTSK
jgi:hypothetical protein